MKSAWKIIHNEKGTTQHDMSVPSLVVNESSNESKKNCQSF